MKILNFLSQIATWIFYYKEHLNLLLQRTPESSTTKKNLNLLPQRTPEHLIFYHKKLSESSTTRNYINLLPQKNQPQSSTYRETRKLNWAQTIATKLTTYIYKNTFTGIKSDE